MQLTSFARYLGLAACISLLTAGCAAPGAYGQRRSAAAQSPSQNYCPDRLPVAQKRIKKMYRQAENESASDDSVGATVRGPGGEQMSVSIETSGFDSTSSSRELGPEDVETGLSDLVFNCGKPHMSDKLCHITVYLDGERITSIGPAASGRVPLKCLPAGRHELRIDSVASTIYKGTIDLDSDVEHLARIQKTEFDEYNFEIYARNPLPDRIPQPSEVSTSDQQSTEATSSSGNVSTSVEINAEAPEGDHRPSPDHSHRDERDQIRDHRHGPGGVDDHSEVRGNVSSETETETRTQRSETKTRTTYRQSTQTTETNVDIDADERRRRSSSSGTDTDDGLSSESVGQPMTDSDFRDLKSQVEDESFRKGKLRVIEIAADKNWFTTEQVSELVSMLRHGSARVQVATTLYERTVDQENFYEVLSVFDMDVHKEEVREKLDL
jgi:hypothetical protein